MYNAFFFDLDGTLTDPGEGITGSVAYALEKYGIKVEDRSTLNCFIGPPLQESFCKYYGFSPEEGYRAVDKYREYYRDKGIFENVMYDGIPNLLSELKSSGAFVVMATSKPEVFARQIAEHFGIAEYFDCITGSELDGRRVAKSEVIACALERMGISNAGSAVMTGDREHDIIGALKNGLYPVGVMYGYGSREELLSSGAAEVVSDVPELTRLLLSLSKE